jgi:hypothetical protein
MMSRHATVIGLGVLAMCAGCQQQSHEGHHHPPVSMCETATGTCCRGG